MAILNKILHVLQAAPRQGDNQDEPEGVRYIQISDTLANELVTELRNHLLMQEKSAVRCPLCGTDMTDRMNTFGLN